MAAGLVLANGLGRRFEGWVDTWHSHHGWPWTYLSRWNATIANPHLTPISPWIGSSDETTFRALPLAGNLIVAIAVLLLAGIVWETVVRCLFSGRSWHPSRHAIVGSVVVLLIAVNLPGKCSTSFNQARHGWPWPFLLRESLTPRTAAPQLTLSPWALHEDFADFRFSAFAGDIVIAFLLCFAALQAWEWRCKRQPRLLQVTLPEALLLVLAVACILAWMVHERRQLEQTLAELRQASLLNASEFDPGGPSTLRELFGDRAANQLWMDVPVRFHAPSDKQHFTDADVAHLAPCAQLRLFNVSGTAITDLGLKPIQRMTRLEHVDLSGTRITDRGMVCLAGLTELRFLNLGQTSVTDRGISHLDGLSHLRDLRLDGTRVGDHGASQLAKFQELYLLGLNETNIGDEGLKHLAALPSLEKLRVSNTRITDAGLAHLRNLRTLLMLELQGTQITDAGLVHVGEIKRLWFLDVRQTNVTDAGLVSLHRLDSLGILCLDNKQEISDSAVAELKRHLPKLQVIGR